MPLTSPHLESACKKTKPEMESPDRVTLTTRRPPCGRLRRTGLAVLPLARCGGFVSAR